VSLQGTDLALLSARVGVARIGAFRLGFAPDDVEGVGTVGPGEYAWQEIKPEDDGQEWELMTPWSMCAMPPVADFTMAGPVTSTVTGHVEYNDGQLHDWVGIDVTMTVDGVPWPGGPAVTDGGGIYTFLNVPDGNINVSVLGLVGEIVYAGSGNGDTVGPMILVIDIVAASA